ncbi:MAG: protein translocase subunit SecD, partial [Nitrospinae bacterium]|nr:protein translocase subunit SecD [Nitrospinota bacterium]
MFKHLKWKIPLILFVILGAVVMAFPLKEKIILGLDLQGGMHLVLEVQAEKAVEATLERIADDIKRALEDEDVEVDRVFERIEENEIHVVLVDTINLDELEKVLANYPALEKIQAVGDGIETVYRLSDDEIEWIQENAVQQALEIIRNRIDQYGVSEPTIQVQGERRILVQLPGIECPKCAVDLIGKTARLEFKLIDETMSVQTAMKTGIPEGDEILYQRKENKDAGETNKGEPFLVKKRAALTGDTLTAAEVRYDSQYNEPYVAITFNSMGADIFRQVTRENIKKRLAIVLDNNVYSAPVIQDEIVGGRAQITGSFTTEEARDLAIILRAGALPAPVTMLENRTVGPSLGRDSIEKGVNSIIIGMAL